MTTPTVIAALIDAANEIERLGGDPSRFHKVVWDALPVEFATTGARFEQAIRDYGVVNACEWFGYRKDDEFTAETIRVLDERLMAGKEPA